MIDSTPPLHPIEREQIQAASPLVVTVKSSDEFHDHVTDSNESLEQGNAVEATLTFSFTSYDSLMETLTARVIELTEAIRRDESYIINETARIVNRNMKNIHDSYRCQMTSRAR
jgi:predicted transcriptional regulator